MRVLQFAFGTDPNSSYYRPFQYSRNSIAYTGTHDNNTTRGWFHDDQRINQTDDDVARERSLVLDFVGSDGAEIHWDFMRLAWSSVSDIAMAPMQDILGLGTEGRMNTPGTIEGNWLWRLGPAQFTPSIQRRLRRLTEICGRLGDFTLSSAMHPAQGL